MTPRGLCVVFFLLIFFVYESDAEYCSQFRDCESCAGRHRVTFEVCVWCPTYNSCVPPTVTCGAGYKEIFDCPRLLPVAYNETFTRNIVTPLIAAAQGSYDQITKCLNRLNGRVQLWKRFAIQTAVGDRCDGYIAIDFDNRAIIASFSSFAAGNRLLFNHFNAEFFTNRQAQFEGTDGLVNRFIYDSWIKIWYVLGMESTLKKLFEFYHGYEFWVVGHAIGGAKAQMAALAVLKKQMITSDKIKLITFGSTRVGDMSFVEMLETQVPYRFRVVHNHDMVVRYPKAFDGEWTPPHHHRYEVWYPNDMAKGSKFFICLGAEDPQCSDRLSPWQIRADENEIYFERSMETWVKSGCDDNVKIAGQSVSRFKAAEQLVPQYDITALRTAAPWTTTMPTPSRPFIQTTPAFTNPPRVTAFTMSLTTTPASFTLPWWYTTKSWSTKASTTPMPTPTTSRESDRDLQFIGKGSDARPAVTQSPIPWWLTTTLFPTTPSSFRGPFTNQRSSFRNAQEPVSSFRGFIETNETTSLANEENSFPVQETDYDESRNGSSTTLLEDIRALSRTTGLVSSSGKPSLSATATTMGDNSTNVEIRHYVNNNTLTQTVSPHSGAITIPASSTSNAAPTTAIINERKIAGAPRLSESSFNSTTEEDNAPPIGPSPSNVASFSGNDIALDATMSELEFAAITSKTTQNIRRAPVGRIARRMPALPSNIKTRSLILRRGSNQRQTLPTNKKKFVGALKRNLTARRSISAFMRDSSVRHRLPVSRKLPRHRNSSTTSSTSLLHPALRKPSRMKHISQPGQTIRPAKMRKVSQRHLLSQNLKEHNFVPAQKPLTRSKSQSIKTLHKKHINIVPNRPMN